MATTLENLRDNGLTEGTAEVPWNRTRDADLDRELPDPAAVGAATDTEHIAAPATDAHAMAANSLVRPSNSPEQALERA